MLGSRGSITKTWFLQVDLLKVIACLLSLLELLNIFVMIIFRHYSTYLLRIFLIRRPDCIYTFTSQADFRNEPALSWMNKLSAEVKLAITRSKILFCNGYGFDELSPNLITSALDYSVEVGTSIFLTRDHEERAFPKEHQKNRGHLESFCR